MSWVRAWRRDLRDAAAVAAASALLSLGWNAFRADGLPLVARSPYEVLVPCPEPGGPVSPVPPGDPAVLSARTFLIDARPLEAFRRSHLRGAVNVPFDWLDPVPEAELRQLARAVAKSRAARVIVYGDGGRPDSGEHLGRELSGRGIRNVGFVPGGAPVLGAEEAGP